jgi:murein DD-endopeptidase MepM/ murein hydrolase activator NlpD
MGDRVGGQPGRIAALRASYYGHLNGFAEGLATGSKVEKGQVIGYVGVTGLTTGPHLHYEFRVDDGSANGIGIPIPPPDVLDEPRVESEAFFKAVQAYRDRRQVAQNAHIVILD